MASSAAAERNGLYSICDRFDSIVNAVNYVCLAKLMVNRKRMVNISRELLSYFRK
jgi:hypothetical protein